MPGKHNGRKRARGDEDAPPRGDVKLMTTELNNTIQKIIKRNLTKGEVAYKIEKVDGGYVATVTTPKMSDAYDQKEHSGEMKDTEVEAKESAATVAVADILADEELKTIHDTPKPEKDMGEKPGPDAPREKGKFRNAVLKIVRKDLTSADIVWETNEVEGGGWQSTLTAPCLPGKWKDINMVGEVCDDQTAAEHSAAAIGLKQLLDDEEMASLHDRKKGQNNQEPKGKGKGAMPNLGAMDPMIAMPMMMMCMANGMNPMMMMQNMQNMMGGGEPKAKRQKKN